MLTVYTAEYFYVNKKTKTTNKIGYDKRDVFGWQGI